MFKVSNANFPFKTFKANFLGPIVVKGSKIIHVPLNSKPLDSYWWLLGARYWISLSTPSNSTIVTKLAPTLQHVHHIWSKKQYNAENSNVSMAKYFSTENEQGICHEQNF